MFYQTFTQRKNPYIPNKELYNIKIRLVNLNSLRRRSCGMRVSTSPSLPQRQGSEEKDITLFHPLTLKGEGGG